MTCAKDYIICKRTDIFFSKKCSILIMSRINRKMDNFFKKNMKKREEIC